MSTTQVAAAAELEGTTLDMHDPFANRLHDTGCYTEMQVALAAAAEMEDATLYDGDHDKYLDMLAGDHDSEGDDSSDLSDDDDGKNMMIIRA